MANTFDTCLAFTLREEGGYVDNPADPGGATNMGITLATLRQYTDDPQLGAIQVRDMIVRTARAIYQALYWNPLRASARGRSERVRHGRQRRDMAVCQDTAARARLHGSRGGRLHRSGNSRRRGQIRPPYSRRCSGRAPGRLLSRLGRVLDFRRRLAQPLQGSEGNRPSDDQTRGRDHHSLKMRPCDCSMSFSYKPLKKFATFIKGSAIGALASIRARSRGAC